MLTISLQKTVSRFTLIHIETSRWVAWETLSHHVLASLESNGIYQNAWNKEIVEHRDDRSPCLC